MVTVKICVGTYCYLMGGGQLAQWRNYIPQHLHEKVTFVSASCLGCNEQNAKPPYAKVGDVIIEKATPEKILEEIEKQLSI
ncbi:MAG: hypothetical protein IJ213_06630 [Bacteroidales bacterium]|nr:hypothetical protein [Bacteroidales bacterium]